MIKIWSKTVKYQMCGSKGSLSLQKRMNFWKSSKRPLTHPIFGKSCCGFLAALAALYLPFVPE